MSESNGIIEFTQKIHLQLITLGTPLGQNTLFSNEKVEIKIKGSELGLGILPTQN